ncbi:hypothetical protein EIP91_005346 [Steccherinum ochraceum]|uniref:Protein UNC80 C-terminal domain-containing protein n=1 Tax=Steccherinum ochraceum TaxID=92696 RepID=A0A4V2MVQ5_9APHY|nr:hypothetical protein EIP91_005346 [Steccherinum ochraceum]
MSQRPTVHVKKPSGGRPPPKRLFSFDALRKDKSVPGNDPERVAGSNGLAHPVDKSIPEDTEDPFTDGEQWTEKPLVTSPQQTVPKEKEKGRRKHPAKPVPLPLLDEKVARNALAAADDAAAPPPSPGRRRWDTVRYHVLPVSGGTETPPRPSTPIDTSSPVPSRPSTPKGYRFGQKKPQVRQVVDEVRAAEEVRRFADELLKACWTVRFGEGLVLGKPERDMQHTIGSTLNMPFMHSSTSLPMSSSASVVSLPVNQKANAGLRRPPSIGSLALTNGALASVTQIAKALTSTTSSNRPRQLPHEHLVWSALLVPFLNQDHAEQDAERSVAMETFQMIIKTWKASSPQVELERCIWCCRAATVPSRARARIISTLPHFLFPKDQTFFADTPALLQTLLQALVSLVIDLSGQADTTSDLKQISGYITTIRSKGFGKLSKSAIEKEYGVRFGKEDRDAEVRDAVIAESIVKCLEVGHENRRRWILHHLLEEYWPTPEPSLSLTPLLACIYWRKLKTFISSTLFLLSASSENASADGEVIIRLFRSRILPEVEAMRTDDAAEIQTQIARLVLELLCVRESDEREYVLMHFCDWYQNKKDWRESIHIMLAQFVKSAEWPKIIHMVPSVLNELPGEVQLPLVTYIMPLVYDRLVHNPPPSPHPRLTSFLGAISEAFPKVFYKPIFSCAAANKETTVINQLVVLNALTNFIPDLWTRDPEMVAFALTSDSSASQSREAGSGPVWGKTRVGQSALLVEITNRLSAVRNSKDMSQTVSAVKFANALEARLGVTLISKEQTTLIPDSQRILFCDLLREIRLLTRSLKPAAWLPSVVTWFVQWQGEEMEGEKTIILERGREDTGTAMNKLLAVYTQAQDTARGASKRSTVLTSPQLNHPTISRSGSEDKLKVSAPAPFEDQLATLKSTAHMLKAPMLELLVCISGLLSAEDYVRLGPPVWNQCMDDVEPKIIAPACFLVMQYAEKGPTEFTQLLEDDLSSPEYNIRRAAIQRFSKLASWRYQMLSLDVILDRSHRRPFKLARPPILFVATDIGSSLFVYEEADDDWKDSHGNVLPLELRRRLSEIGWAQEDRKVDQKTQWIRTPMSLIPSVQLDKMDSSYADAMPKDNDTGSPTPSPEPSPSKGSRGDTSLTRQDSTSSGRAGIRRRPVFVMTLISLFPRLTSMVLDRDFGVASAALDLVMDFMRDDPTLLARAVFSLLASDEQGLSMAITTLRAFLHVRHVLPPAMAHHALNHLTGFLKSSMKHAVGTAPSLQSYAYSMPIIADLMPQVNNLSIREIRRAKIDMFLTPTGALWFPPSAPMGAQFPRLLKGSTNPFEPLPSSLVWITLIRTSQNKLFLNMLKRDPQDIKVIRKHMTRLVLPSLDAIDDDSPLTLVDMLPHRHALSVTGKTSSDMTLQILSITLARSYLLLICQVFQSMSRHLNDRNELSVLVDGVSRILVNHGQDINIVAHCMIGMALMLSIDFRHGKFILLAAFMAASTRFRRLFTSGGGYTLFMPAVVKVYVEADGNPGIRAAIEYAVNRFYALHEDSFVFQTFDIASNITVMPSIDGPWVADGLYSLFSSLRNSIPPTASDPAGIQGINKVQEKEALMMSMVDEGPQLLGSFKRGSKTEKSQNPLNAPIPEEYEGRRLSMDNLIRLFLTVIAHNPTIQRAENFLRVLRLLAPHLYHASSSARNVLRDGIIALANILLTKAGGKSKSSDGAPPNPSDNPSLETISEGISQIAALAGSQAASPSDALAMRLDFLSLVVAYCKAGGSFNPHASQRVLEVIKSVLKDPRPTATQISTFVTDYARSILIRDPLPSVKQVNALLLDLAPLVNAYFGSVDFSGLYDVVAELASNSVFAVEVPFANIVVTQYCRYGLEHCELAASENILFTMRIRGSLLRLIDSAVSMMSVDVIAEIASRTPSSDLLAGIVLPFALRLKTSEAISLASQYTDAWRRETHSRAWVHLLTYILNIIEGVEVSREPRKGSSSRRKSQDSDRLESAAVMTFAMALQVLKIIVVRAEDDISVTMPGIWARLGAVLKSALSDGNALFALKTLHDFSEPPSPSFSPRTSSFSPQVQPQLNFPSSFPSSASIHQRRPLSPPRMIDYITWSFIQWLWLRRNPLILQMRIFVQERIANLAQELAEGTTVSSASVPRSRRISAVFSKPRRSMMVPSAPSSAASTPRNSMFLSSSMSFPLPADVSSSSLSPFADNARQPGYARIHSPNTASSQESTELTAPRIVHLGPVNISSASRSPGGSHIHGRTVRSMAKEMMIASPMLTRATYRRIRLVQHLMGFRDLLPMGEDGSAFGEDDHPESEVKAWTKRDALEAVMQETRDLLDEFRAGEDELGDESAVIVDSEETLMQVQDYSSNSSH